MPATRQDTSTETATSMAKHFQKELEKIKKMILALGAMVEERLHMASSAIEDRDSDIARNIIKTDFEIDEMEVEVEEECLKALALYQPVAVDLRFLIATIKINNDLERIADEAVNIARRVKDIAGREVAGVQFDFSLMADKAQEMLRMSLDALVNLDLDLAFKVVTLDDDVDKLHRRAYDQIRNVLSDVGDGGETGAGLSINYYLLSRHLERIADHATNIAEEVIYLIEGEIVRHADY
jgi:phosphate transport system protein